MSVTYEYRCVKCGDRLETNVAYAEPFYNTHKCDGVVCDGNHRRHYTFGVGYVSGSGSSPSRPS